MASLRNEIKEIRSIIEKSGSNDDSPSSGKTTLNSVYREGYLSKQGHEFHNWKNRYFVLLGDKLFYFKMETDEKALGFIHLKNSTIWKLSQLQLSAAKKKKLIFQIVTANKDTWLLRAKNQFDLDNWFKSIKKAILRSSGQGERDIKRHSNQINDYDDPSNNKNSSGSSINNYSNNSENSSSSSSNNNNNNNNNKEVSQSEKAEDEEEEDGERKENLVKPISFSSRFESKILSVENSSDDDQSTIAEKILTSYANEATEDIEDDGEDIEEEEKEGDPKNDLGIIEEQSGPSSSEKKNALKDEDKEDDALYELSEVSKSNTTTKNYSSREARKNQQENDRTELDAGDEDGKDEDSYLDGEDNKQHPSAEQTPSSSELDFRLDLSSSSRAKKERGTNQTEPMHTRKDSLGGKEEEEEEEEEEEKDAEEIQNREGGEDEPPEPQFDDEDGPGDEMDSFGKLKKGASFLKFGRRGTPHVRFVYCSPGLDMLYWRNPGRMEPKPTECVPVSKFLEISTGAKTKVFQRKNNKDAVEKLCFSLISSERTLDLQATSESQKWEWVRLLRKLCFRSGKTSE